MIRFVISGISLLAILLCLSMPLGAQSQYLWPLIDGDKYGRFITSAFAEYRADRFHAGIDIKTILAEGHKVIAVDDGWLYRIKVSPFGYGKSLYIILKDGNIVVYAHLRDFVPAFQSLIENEQQRTGTFSVDMWFSAREIPIKRGEVLGTTGRSGTTLQHLHFELRDNNNRPVNPVNHGFSIQDNQPPHPVQICFRPMDLRSSVNGNWLPYIIPVGKSSKNIYTIDKPVPVWGNIGIGVNVSDQNGVYGNNYGVYSLVLIIDNKELFSARYDYYDYADNLLINSDRDYQLLRRDVGLFQKLYVDEGNTLPFYGAYRTGDGIININDSTRNSIPFEILITDFCENQSKITGLFTVQSPTYTILSAKPQSGELGFFENKSASGGKEGDTGLRTKSVRKFTVEEDFQPHFYYVSFTSQQDLLYLPEAVYEEDGKPKTPRVLGVRALSPRRFTAVCSFDSINDINGNIHIMGESKDFQYDTMLPVLAYRVTPKGRRLSLPNDEGTVIIQEGIILHDMLFRAGIEEYNNSREKYEMVSDVFTFNPKEMFLRANIYIELRYPENDLLPEKLGMYARDNENNWHYIGGILQTNRSRISMDISSLETIAVIRDTIPPVIHLIEPNNGEVLEQKRPEIAVWFDDEFSGIAEETDMALYIDDNKVIAEWEPIMKKLFYIPKRPLTSGSHRVRFNVQDRMKNNTEKVWSFVIK